MSISGFFQIEDAKKILSEGKLIAYPTEAVYGLGCDPFNKHAVEKLLALKQRPSSKGFIILIAEWSQLTPLIGDVPENLLDNVRATWPGPVTWVFPRSNKIPDWLCGHHSSIAIRMSAHPVARGICSGGAVISTSANISGAMPAVDLAGLSQQFPHGIDAIFSGDLGGTGQLSSIFDVLTGQRLR